MKKNLFKTFLLLLIAFFMVVPVSAERERYTALVLKESNSLRLQYIIAHTCDSTAKDYKEGYQVYFSEEADLFEPALSGTVLLSYKDIFGDDAVIREMI